MRVEVPEKLAFTLFWIVFSMAASWYLNAGSILLLLLVRLTPPFRPFSDRSRRSFTKILSTLAFAAVLMTLANGIFLKGGTILVDAWGLSVYKDGVFFGLRVAARLLLIATALLLLFGSTPLATVASFLHRAGLPPQVIMTFLLTLYFIEQLPERIERIFTAQEARGARIRSNVFTRLRSFSSVFSPLILSSMVESVDRGMALELRGFHNRSQLSFRSEPEARRGFSMTTIVFLGLSLVCVLWILAQWLLP